MLEIFYNLRIKFNRQLRSSGIPVLSHVQCVFQLKTSRFVTTPKTPKLGRWLAGLILLFLLSQTAGLLHAEIHPFHKHTASCELFEQLAQPVDSGHSFTFSFFKPAPIIPYGFALVSVFEAPFTAHFFGRAPPISF